MTSTAQRIAFRRLLWAAIETPDNGSDGASEFFRHSWHEFAELAADNFDDLIGAAATLSDKYEQADTASSLALANDMLSHMERKNKRNAIDSLQSALIEWAAIGAKSMGHKGIEGFLELYRKLPENQTQMRGNMIVHVSKLLTGVESLTLVLSDWYRALMDENTVIRASAVQAWENVPYNLVKNFPDLFFEAFSILLLDPYVMVHKSAVRALRHRSFTEEKRDFIKLKLWTLIVHYSQERNQEDFVVDCIDAYAFLCLSSDERKEIPGQLLSAILLTLKGSALYHAVDRLHYGFRGVPGFAKVALKSIQDEYTRSISIDDCVSAILSASKKELQNCVDDIKKAFEALKPFKKKDFVEALVYAAALTKAGNYAAAGSCFRELVSNIPVEARNEQWRLKAALVAVASEIENAIDGVETVTELIKEWNGLLSTLENENEERAILRDFPSSFFPES